MPESQPTVVGVDVGSSAARAVAINRHGEVVGESAARYPEGSGLPIGQVDPFTWLTGFTQAITSLAVTPAAIGAGGHGPTSVAAGGEAALTFRHPAGESSSPPDQHAAQTGVLREMFGAHVQPRQLWDWVLTQLGGDGSYQSVWPSNTPLAEFGEPIPVGTSIGVTDGSHGLPIGIPLVPGSNDAYLTAWAGGIDIPGRGFDPGGRTGGLGVAVEASADKEAMAYAMPSAVPGVHIVGGPVAAHGTILDWWAEITGRKLTELIDLAAEVPPGRNGVLVLPFLEGERAPRWNPALRAEIIGLHVTTDAGVITRALLEATAYGLGHIAREVAGAGAVLTRLVASGGPSRSHLWTTIKSAVLEVPVDVPACDEMSAYGAALAAGAALGWWPRPGEGRSGDWPQPAMTTIEAEPLDVYRAGLERFIELGDQAVARLG